MFSYLYPYVTLIDPPFYLHLSAMLLGVCCYVVFTFDHATKHVSGRFQRNAILSIYLPPITSHCPFLVPVECPGCHHWHDTVPIKSDMKVVTTIRGMQTLYEIRGKTIGTWFHEYTATNSTKPKLNYGLQHVALYLVATDCIRPKWKDSSFTR